jgi:ABC-type Fe3+/spermidine/putrescine transport system ATPase subunit
MRYEMPSCTSAFKTTMVYVTHDQVEAMTLADRIVVLSAGRIEQVGSPMALYEHPCNLFVAGFIGSPGMNFIDATVVQAGAQGATVKLGGGEKHPLRRGRAGAKVGDKVKLGVRPEHLHRRRGRQRAADHGDLRRKPGQHDLRLLQQPRRGGRGDLRGGRRPPRRQTARPCRWACRWKRPTSSTPRAAPSRAWWRGHQACGLSAARWRC